LTVLRPVYLLQTPEAGQLANGIQKDVIDGIWILAKRFLARFPEGVEFGVVGY
jgi:hypothetical protein